ncbi:insulinase family protein [Bacteroidota bacterium]
MKKYFIVLLLTLLTALPLYGQFDRSIIPDPGPAPEINIGEYESFELPNGLKVFVVENHKLPRVAFSLVLDIDPLQEGENAGFISAAGELLRTGTKNRNKDEIDSEIDFIGATLNTSATSIYGMALKKQTEKLLNLISDIILNAEFKQKELDKIKTQMLSGLRAQKEDPDAIAQVVGNAILYGKDHPYGEAMTEKTVESFTLQMCIDYYKKYFRPNVAYLAVVGDITKSEAEDLITKYFSSWEKKDVPQHEYDIPTAPRVNNVAIVDRSAAVQSVVGVGYPLELKKGSPDVIPLSVMNTILGGSFISRLNHNIREDKGWTYGAGSTISSDQVIGYFKAGTTVRNSVTDSTVTEIMYEIKKLIEEKVSEEELQSTKNFMTGGFARALENPQTIANFALNTARYNLPADYYKNYLKNLNAVTIDDIHKMANKYLKIENAHIVVVGNAEEVADKLKKFNIGGKINYYDTYGNEYDPSIKEVDKDVTVDKVINNYIEAIGGKTNIERVDDLAVTMKGFAMGNEIVFTVYQKFPNLYYQYIDAGAFEQKVIFDGKRAKQIQMGQKSYLEGVELEAMKIDAQMNSFLDYEKHGIIPKLTGKEKINEIDCYKVLLYMPTGKQWTQYYSIKDGFLVRQITPITTEQGVSNTIVDYSDYQPIEGVMYPFKVTQHMGMGKLEMTTTSVDVNTGLDESFFSVD